MTLFIQIAVTTANISARSGVALHPKNAAQVRPTFSYLRMVRTDVIFLDGECCSSG